MVAGTIVFALLIWLVAWWSRSWRQAWRQPWPEQPRRTRPYLADVGVRAEEIVQVECSRMMAEGEIPFDRDST